MLSDGFKHPSLGSKGTLELGSPRFKTPWIVDELHLLVIEVPAGLYVPPHGEGLGLPLHSFGQSSNSQLQGRSGTRDLGRPSLQPLSVHVTHGGLHRRL